VGILLQHKLALLYLHPYKSEQFHLLTYHTSSDHRCGAVENRTVWVGGPGCYCEARWAEKGPRAMVYVWHEREAPKHCWRIYPLIRVQGRAAEGQLNHVWEALHFECEFAELIVAEIDVELSLLPGLTSRIGWKTV